MLVAASPTQSPRNALANKPWLSANTALVRNSLASVIGPSTARTVQNRPRTSRRLRLNDDRTVSSSISTSGPASENHVNTTTPGTTKSNSPSATASPNRMSTAISRPYESERAISRETGSPPPLLAGQRERDGAAVEHLSEQAGGRLDDEADHERHRRQVQDLVDMAHVDLAGAIRERAEQPDRDEHEDSKHEQEAGLPPERRQRLPVDPLRGHEAGHSK